MNEEGSKKQSVFERFMRFLNVLVIFALLAAYAGGVVSPEKFWPLAFATMGYPVILVSLLISTAYWIIRRRWFLFINIAFLLIQWNYVTSTFQLPQGEFKRPEDGINVMSFNVRLFDYYRWAEDEDTRRKSFEYLYRNQPNILCIQEFYVDSTDDFKVMDTLLNGNVIKHGHFENYRDNQHIGRKWGMATFSSYPIVNKGVIDFTSTYGNRCIYSDLKVKDDTIRVYNVHLQSVRIGNDQYLFIDQLMLNKSMKGVPVMKLLADMKLLVNRMVYAFIERGKQAQQVKDHMNLSPYPTILCGDFNDTPNSFAYNVLREGMDDTFVEHGSGFGNTFVRVPFFRIDNIFYSSEFDSRTHEVEDDAVLSDHYPILSNISLKD
jgi:endonuclease/exonuclease/phosphatase family metal-dependent hydrolase